MRELVGRARPLAITFHRAFDACADPHAALDTLARLGVDRVLTSGQEATALEGLELLVELVARAAGRLGVMPACGDLLPRHVRHVVDTSRAPECHVTGFAGRESGMRFRRARLYMGGALRPPEYHRSVTTADEIRSVVDALHVP